MKAVLALLLVLGLACAPVQPVPTERLNPVEYAVRRSVFLKQSGCSGVEVARNVVVTAKHCLPDDAKVNDSFEAVDLDDRGGVIGYISPEHDFAVVYFSLPVGVDLIPMRPAKLGEHVYVVGWPQQMEGKQALTVTDGIVAGPVDSDGQARITAPVYFGNSGGGVWADDGSLVGIAVSIYAVDIEGYSSPVPYVAQSFMVPIALVRAAL